MEVATFNELPSTTNPVEVYNRLAKHATPDALPVALMTIYKQDKVASLQHIAATNGYRLGMMTVARVHNLTETKCSVLQEDVSGYMKLMMHWVHQTKNYTSKAMRHPKGQRSSGN